MRDLDEVFERLKGSAFRRKFRLGKVEEEYLRTRGFNEVLEHARSFLERRLAPAQPEKDGKQTPFRGHPVFIAQHATATCCRGCVAKWHGIPAGRELTSSEISQLVDAIERWLRENAAVEGSGGVQHDLWR
jgi:hypothetical protein